MAEVIRYNHDFREFVKANNDFLDDAPLLNHHLHETIMKVLRGKGSFPLHACYNIIDGDKRIVCLWADNELLIYGNGHNNEMITLLDKEINFSQFKKYTIAGNKDIIDTVFAPYNFESEILKHRIIYKCEKVSDLNYASGQCEMAQPHHIEWLAPYGVEFSKDYYGADLKTEDEMVSSTLSSIAENNMYIWTDQGEIVSMVQAMHNEHDFPIIGFFYTPPQYRGKGYGTSILHRVTKGLLENGNEFVMLVADALNPASNKTFIKTGYKSMGNYVRIFKKRRG